MTRLASLDRSTIRGVGLGLTSVLFAGCFGIGEMKAPKPKLVAFPRDNISDGTRKEPRLIGRVAMVNEESRFVLVSCDAWKAPEAGTALKCIRGGTEAAILSVNAERRGAYVTADVVTGTPARGDEVFQ